MKSGLCENAASPALHISEGIREHLHRECKHPECECRCHSGHRPVLPVVVEPARVDRAPTRTAPDGRCEHCGAPCGKRSRFAAGHDAKLKSQLWGQARNGNAKSFAELYLRGWATGDESQVPLAVFLEGQSIAEQTGYTFVERRNAARKRVGGPEPVSS